MRVINYLLLAVLLTGCTSLFGQDSLNYTPEVIRETARRAELGDAEAQAVLGSIYHLGLGVPQDYQKSAKWLRRAAEQGYAKAQINLGYMYKIGHGVPQDDQLAAYWARRAAEQGHTKAQAVLGGMYALGQGAPKDYVLAYKWLNLAAAQGVARKNRDDLAEKMNTSQIQEAEKLAREFKPKKENPKKENP